MTKQNTPFNMARAAKLADFIESHKVDVNMSCVMDGKFSFSPERAKDIAQEIKKEGDCGSFGCLIGWIVTMNAKAYEKFEAKNECDAYKFAENWIGAKRGWFSKDENRPRSSQEDDAADALFNPAGWRDSDDMAPHIQRNRAVKLLRGQIKFTRDWLYNPKRVRAAA